MNRLHLHFLVLLLWGTVAASGQKPSPVMDWKTDATVNTWLIQRLQELSAGRRKAFAAALRSPAAARAYSASVRRRFRALLGPMPERTPLHARIGAAIQRSGYRVTPVLYESFPGHHVTASLYVPEGKGPFPAALLFCGHEDVAKATDSYQRTAILLARHGFVVLCIDPVSQGERYQLTDSAGRPLTRGGTTEHTLLNAAGALVGTSLPADELWDNSRGLDFLCTRPEVDTSRIGCLGNSGGGMQTLYFAAFDDRVKVFAPCSYLATRERTLELSGPADGCAQIPGEGAQGLELADLLLAAAPKPVLVLAGRYDFIDYAGAVEAAGQLKNVYQVLGQSSKTSLFTADDGHGISRPKREAAVRWFRRWLYGDNRPVREDSFAVETPEALFAAGGSLARTMPDEVDLAERNRRLAAEAATARARFSTLPAHSQRAFLKRFLRLAEQPVPDAEDRGVYETGAMRWHRVILRVAGEPPLPLLWHRPVQARRVVLLCGGDKFRVADSIAALPERQRAETVFLLADLRGTGETADRAGANDPKYYNREYRNAGIALHLGDPMPVQRLRDLQGLLAYARGVLGLDGLAFELAAEGLAVVPALHALVLDPGIRRLYLAETPRDWASWLQMPAGKDLYSITIPGVLRYYDLRELRAIAGDRIQYTR